MERNKAQAIFILGILVSILVACGGDAIYAPPSPFISSLTPTKNSPDGIVTLPSNSAMPTETPTANSTINSSTATHMVWYTTALAYQSTQSAKTQKFWINNATQNAQFSMTCEEGLSLFDVQVSSNREWIAYSCGNKDRQKLIVQNKDGKKWIVKPEDVFSPDGHYSGLKPVFWDPEGKYLYVGRSLGFSGGGDHCFPSAEHHIGYYGYFQLNLHDGSWITILPQTNRFPGYDMQFSPSGRRYAVDVDGITIADFKTGDVVKLDVYGVVDFGWSPDGRYLAYFVASCDESGWPNLASVYAWDSKTSQSQLLFTVEKYVLYLESWIDASTLRVIAEKLVKTEDVRMVNGVNVCPCYNGVYDIYLYDIVNKNFIFSGTATPYP